LGESRGSKGGKEDGEKNGAGNFQAILHKMLRQDQLRLVTVGGRLGDSGVRGDGAWLGLGEGGPLLGQPLMEGAGCWTGEGQIMDSTRLMLRPFLNCIIDVVYLMEDGDILCT